MLKTSILIIGGGLSGLYAAYLLEQAGFKDYLLLEAKDHLGGRVYSKEQIDLGATWIWPDLNPELMKSARISIICFQLINKFKITALP